MKNTTSLFVKRPDPIVLTEELRIEKSLAGQSIYLNYSIGSDTYPYEICYVSPSGKQVWAKQMEVSKKGTEFHSSDRHQLKKFSLRKSGSFKQVGKSVGYAKPSYEPEYYYDYSF